MSKTANALLTKWIATFIVTMICFRFIAHASWTTVFLLSFATTLVNFLIGDFVVLPAMGNVIASITDGVLGVVAALLFGAFSDFFAPSALSLVLFGVLIAVFEYFFHMYLYMTKRVAH